MRAIAALSQADVSAVSAAGVANINALVLTNEPLGEELDPRYSASNHTSSLLGTRLSLTMPYNVAVLEPVVAFHFAIDNALKTRLVLLAFAVCATWWEIGVAPSAAPPVRTITVDVVSAAFASCRSLR